MNKIITALLIISLGLLVTCDSKNNRTVIEGMGIITYVDLEGGFYGIVSENGDKYEPANLPSEFRKDGLHVFFRGELIENYESIYMWGEGIELTFIEQI